MAPKTPAVDPIGSTPARTASPPVRTAPMVDGRIKEYILLNRLAPGDPMPTETELCEQLGVSRSRIREAIKTLSALDIVEVRHGYGTYVGRLSLTAMVESLAFRAMLSAPEDRHMLTDLIDVREFLETSLVPIIIEHLTPQAALTMRRLTSTMQENAGLGQESPAEDREFHMLLMQTTGNALAVQLTAAFWDAQAIAFTSLEQAQDLRSTADRHAAIIDAIEDGDPDLLREAIRAHYEPIRTRMAHATLAAAANS